MELISTCNPNPLGISQLNFVGKMKMNTHRFPRTCPFNSGSKFKSQTSSPFKVSCNFDDELSTTSWAYSVLGLDSDCSSAQLKDAFRAKVKQFHPDVVRDGENSNATIRRIIRAYEILSNCTKSEIIEREYMDPFDKPECEALDIFVNQAVCIGKGCPYSCVNAAPHAFKFSSATGTACAVSQGHGEDYQVQLAVGQCPRNCIHYVTPSQRIILEELLGSILNVPYDTSAEAKLLYSLIVKASYENNRFQIPKKKAKASNNHVDWY